MEYCQKGDFRARGADEWNAAECRLVAVNANDMSDDYILQDYLPDCKRVVWTKARPVITGRFVGAEEAEFEGKVIYDLLCVSEDGKLVSASFESPFSGKVNGEGITSESVDLIEPRVVQPVTRLLNPRKVNIRSRVETFCCFFNSRCFMPELYGQADPEMKVADNDALSVACMHDDDLTFSAEIGVDRAVKEPSAVVDAGAEIIFDDIRADSSGVTVSGNCEVECVFAFADGGDYYSVRRSFPVSHTFEGESVKNPSGENCAARASVGAFNVNLREDEGGEMRMAEIDLDYTCDLIAVSQRKLKTVCDCYCPDGECKFTDSEASVPALAFSSRGSFSVGESVLAGEGAGAKPGPDTQVVASHADITFGKKLEKSRRGRAVVCGEANICVIGKGDDGALSEYRFTVPVKCETDSAFPEGELLFFGDSAVTALRVRADSEAGKFYVDFEVKYDIMCLDNRICRYISSVKTSPVEKKADTSRVLLAFPAPGETFWDIAKKYSVSRDALASENGMDGSCELSPGAVRIPACNKQCPSAKTV